MNLIELIRLNNRLENLTIDDLRQESENRFNLIIDQINVPAAKINTGFQERLIEKNYTLQLLFSNLEQELTDLKSEVHRLIENQGQSWLHQNYTEYEKYLETRYAQKPEYLGLHRNKPVQLTDEVKTIFKNRVAGACDWHHPAMIIHPMLESFTQEMVGADPLYIVDESHYLIEPTMSQFVQGYQYRLRPYVIEESFDHPILGQLPDQQIGFCLAFNYLDYRPFELVKKYLEEVYQKLQPGGIFAFTFNDCDRYQAMQSVEQGITGYTPGSLVRAWAEYLGFEEIFHYQQSGSASTWIEFKKAGTLTSLRGGQCLAKILPKPVANSK